MVFGLVRCGGAGRERGYKYNASVPFSLFSRNPGSDGTACARGTASERCGVSLIQAASAVQRRRYLPALSGTGSTGNKSNKTSMIPVNAFRDSCYHVMSCNHESGRYSLVTAAGLIRKKACCPCCYQVPAAFLTNSSIFCAWPFGVTPYSTWASLPSGATTKVERTIPIFLVPFFSFSWYTP